MDSEERKFLVNRIISGKLFAEINYNFEKVSVVFTDPSLFLLVESDFVYQKYLTDGLTLKESFEILRARAEWDDKREGKLLTIENNVKRLKKQMLASYLFKTKLEQISAQIKVLNSEYNSLIKQKYSLWPNTIECLADLARRRFLIKNMVNIDFTDRELSFVDNLVVCYYEKNSVSEETIRELARTEPWRLYWQVSKKTGTSLFPCASVQITELQHNLSKWTNIYDWAYENMDCPPDDVISNDLMFDGWLISQNEKNEKESKERFTGRKQSGGTGREEVFIPTDAKGAKEVYSLNDPGSKHTIKQRMKHILNKGVVNEIDLPDMKREIIMAGNKASFERNK